jgi:hypothetical protein
MLKIHLENTKAKNRIYNAKKIVKLIVYRIDGKKAAKVTCTCQVAYRRYYK